MRRLLAALAAICFFAIAASPADAKAKGNGKTAVIYRGLGGQILQPMLDIAADLKRRGYRVTFDFAPPGRPTLAVGHSFGTGPALASGAERIITIDVPCRYGDVQAPRGSRVVAFHTDFYCGVRGARNIRVAGSHVMAPTTARRRILSLL